MLAPVPTRLAAFSVFLAITLPSASLSDSNVAQNNMQNASEADARIVIDQLLREADWDPADKRQVSTEALATWSVQNVHLEAAATFTDGELGKIGRERS
jgi:hypothetical protein